MTKIEKIKQKLCHDADGTVMWMDGGILPHGLYDTEEISGLQITLMPEGYDEVFVVMILPGDEYGLFDVYVRRMGSNDMTHMLSMRARDPEDVAVAALENLPDYII